MFRFRRYHATLIGCLFAAHVGREGSSLAFTFLGKTPALSSSISNGRNCQINLLPTTTLQFQSIGSTSSRATSCIPKLSLFEHDPETGTTGKSSHRLHSGGRRSDSICTWFNRLNTAKMAGLSDDEDGKDPSSVVLLSSSRSTLWKLFVNRNNIFSGGGGSMFLFVIMGLIGLRVYRGIKYKDRVSIGSFQPNWRHVVTSDAEDDALHAYTCKTCGTTIFIAKGRERRFFNPLNKKCRTCGASGADAFYDRRSEIKVEEKDEEVQYEDPSMYRMSKKQRKELEEKKKAAEEEKALTTVAVMEEEVESEEGGAEAILETSEGEVEVEVAADDMNAEDTTEEEPTTETDDSNAVVAEAVEEKAEDETVEEETEESGEENDDEAKEEEEVVVAEEAVEEEPEPEPEPERKKTPVPIMDSSKPKKPSEVATTPPPPPSKPVPASSSDDLDVLGMDEF